MKKFYAITLCSLVALSASADGLRFKAGHAKKGMKKPARTEAATPVWRPVSQTDYMHDGEDWMELGTVSFKYDARGNCTEDLMDEDGFLSRIVTTYDEYNQPVTRIESESEDGESWTDNSKTTYKYDSKVHDFYTERMGYDWDEEWVANYKCETNTITRNADGNITEIVKSLPLDGKFHPAYKSEWKYGQDGKANEYYYYTMGQNNEWELDDDISYRDIVWEKTDGQMTIYGDMLELVEGANLMKSAVVYYGGEPDGHYLVEWSNNDRDFLIKETTNDINEIGRTTRMEVLDANGSMRFTVTEYFDEEGNITTEPVYISVQEATMDEHGNMVAFTAKETMDGVEELVDGQKFTYTYDADGNVTEVITEQYDYETEEYFLSDRTVYGEYINVASSGIQCIQAVKDTAWTVLGDEVTATASGLKGLSVYNMQGVCVKRVAADDASASVSLTDMAAGIYIVRADGTGATYRLIKN